VDSVRYSSACSCIGVTESTITVSAPVTITSTTTYTTTTTTTSTTSTINAVATASVCGSATVGSGYCPVGCFEDRYVNYPYVAASYSFPRPFTLETCARTCAGSTYFGVYDSLYCICGSSFDFTMPDDPKYCNVPCNGNPSTFCGGLNGASGYPVWNFYRHS
jgi:hypothetical protein